jgi:hypothetical protein
MSKANFEPINCPHCDINLLGDKIPDDIKKHYRGTHWKREIGIYDINLDRTVKYQCPDCKGEWPVDLKMELTPKARKKLGL